MLIEIVYCKITGKTRSLPKIHHFVPLEPWTCRKIKGKKRVINIDKPEEAEPKKPKKGWTKKNKDTDILEEDDQIKVVLDMSNDGPTFKMLESILKAAFGKNSKSGDYEALRELLRNGIPGLEHILSSDGQGFARMSDDDKARFLAALTGTDGKVNGKAAAVLIAAAASGGDPEIANKIVAKMTSGIGDEIDPALMAALMATTAMVSQGASNEEILRAMQKALENSGLSPEEILAKTMLLQKAMAGDDSPAFINKSILNALKAAGLESKEFAKALRLQKIMGALDATPEDLAKCLKILSVLQNDDIDSNEIAEALSRLCPNEALATYLEAAIGKSHSTNIKEEDVSKCISLIKVLEGGKIRGFKEILKLFDGDVSNAKDIEEALSKAIHSGALSRSAIAKCLIFQKAIASCDADAETIGKTFQLQKKLNESGMSKQEIANALAFALLLDKDNDSSFENLKNSLYDLLNEGLSPEEIECTNAVVKSILENDNSISEETVRLLKKAMKQRRGSVENVTETLMATLAASGESQENIVKAMVKALKATGASPEEITKNLSQSLKKGGTSVLEIAKLLSDAMIEAEGSVGPEARRVVKEIFSKVLKDDPSAAPLVARILAESLAFGGSSLGDIIDAMKDLAEIGAKQDEDGMSPEDLMDIIDVTSRIMIEAGADSADIEDAIKAIFDASNHRPDIMEEMTKVMASGMAATGASAQDIARAVKNILSPLSLSIEDAAQLTLQAVAGSNCGVDGVAKIMQDLKLDTGMSSEELEFRTIDSMIQSGAQPIEIAKTMARFKLLETMGISSDKTAELILQEIRSGNELDPVRLGKIFDAAGIDNDNAAKLLAFQKSLGALDIGGADLARSLLLIQDLCTGIDSEMLAAKILNQLSSDGNFDNVDKVLGSLENDSFGYDDIIKGLQFNASMQNGDSASEKIKNLCQLLSSNMDVCDINQLASMSGVSPMAIKGGLILKKLLNDLGLPPMALSKFLNIQKHMYDQGASPQDIADIIKLAIQPISEDDITALRRSLNSDITESDIKTLSSLQDAFHLDSMSQDDVCNTSLMQEMIHSNTASKADKTRELLSLYRPGMSPEDATQLVIDVLNEVELNPMNALKGLTISHLIGEFKVGQILSLLSELESSLRSSDDTLLPNILKDMCKQENIAIKPLVTMQINALDKQNTPEKDDTSSAVHNSNNKVFETNLFIKSLLSQLGNTSENSAVVIKDFLKKQKIPTESLIQASIINKLRSKICDGGSLGKIELLNNLLKEKGVPKGIFVSAINTLVGDDEKEKVFLDAKKLLLGMIENGALWKDQTFSLEKDKDAMSELEACNTSDLDTTIDNALGAMDLEKDELAKMMMVQKILSATGVDPKVIAKFMLLQKTLIQSGEDPTKIAKILSDVLDAQGCDAVLSDLMSQILSGEMSVSEMDIMNLQDLEKMLSSGPIAGESVSKKNVDQLLLLKKSLKASGMSNSEICNILNDITNNNMSDKEIENILAKVLSKEGMSLKHLEMAKGVGDFIKDCLQANHKIVTKGMEDLSDLQSLLKKCGIKDDALYKSLSAAINDNDQGEILKLIEDKVVSPYDKAKAKELLSNIMGGALFQENLNSDALKKAKAIREGLKLMGRDGKEAEEIVCKILNGRMTKDALIDLLETVGKSSALPPDVKAEILNSITGLADNNLNSTQINTRTLKNLLNLHDILQKSDLDPLAINELIIKATTGLLTEKEFENIRKRAERSQSISSEEKSILASLKSEFVGTNLALKRTTPEDMAALSLLEQLISCSEDNEDAVFDKLNKIIQNGDDMTLLRDLAEKLSDDILNKSLIDGLIEDIKHGRVSLPKMSPEELDKICKCKKELQKMGWDPSDVSDIVANVINFGLTDADISRILKEHNNKADIEKAIKDIYVTRQKVSTDQLKNIVMVKDMLDREGLSKSEIRDLMSLPLDELEKSITSIMLGNMISDDSGIMLEKVVDPILRQKVLFGLNIDMEQLKIFSKLMELSNKANKTDEALNVLLKALNGSDMEEELENFICSLLKCSRLSDIDKGELTDLKQKINEGCLQVNGIRPQIVNSMLDFFSTMKSLNVKFEDSSRVLKLLIDEECGKPRKSSVQRKINDYLAQRGYSAEKIKTILDAIKHHDLDDGISNLKMDRFLFRSIMNFINLLQCKGYENKEIEGLVSRATGEGLTADLIEEIFTNLPKDLQNVIDINNLQIELEHGGLRLQKVPEELIASVMNLGTWLKDKNVENLDSLLSTILENIDDKVDVSEIMANIDKLIELSSSDRAKLIQLLSQIESNSEHLAKLKPAIIQNLTKVIGIEAKSPEERENLTQLTIMAINQGLSQKQVEDYVKRNLPHLKKSQLESLTSVLTNKAMKAGMITEDIADVLKKLHDALRKSDVGDEEDCNDLLRFVCSNPKGGLSAFKSFSIKNYLAKSFGQIEQELSQKANVSAILKMGDLSSLVSLDAILSKSNLSQEEKEKLLEKLNQGIFKGEEIDHLLDKLTRSSGGRISARERDELREIIQNGSLQKNGLTRRNASDMSKIKQILAATLGAEKAMKIVGDMLTCGMTKEDKEEVLALLARDKTLDAKQKEALTQAINSDSASIGPVSTKFLENLNKLQDLIPNLGLTEEEASSIIAEITTKGLTGEELKSKLSHLQLSDRQKKNLQAAIEILDNNNLQASKSKENLVEAVLLLSDIMKKDNKCQNKIAEALGDKCKMRKLLSELQNSNQLSPLQKSKLAELQSTIDELEFKGTSVDTVNDIILMKKMLVSSGLDNDTAAKKLIKIGSQGLRKEELAELLEKAKSSGAVTESELEDFKTRIGGSGVIKISLDSSVLKGARAINSILNEANLTEKEKLHLISSVKQGDYDGLENVLQSVKENMPSASETQKLFQNSGKGALKAANISSRNLNSIAYLTDELNKLNIDGEEIVSSLLRGTMSDMKKDDILKQLLQQKDLTDEKRAKLLSIWSQASAGLLDPNAIDNDSWEALCQVQACLKDLDLPQDVINKVISKAMQGSLTETDKKDLESLLMGIDNSKDIMQVLDNLNDSKICGGEEAEKVLALKNLLECIGKSPGEIHRIVSLATGRGMTAEEVDCLMKEVASSNKISRHDMDLVVDLERSLRDGSLRKQKVNSQTINSLLKVSDLLQEESINQTDVIQFLKELSAAQNKDIASTLIDQMRAKLDPEKGDVFSALAKNFLQELDGNKASLSPEVLETSIELHNALLASGYSKKEAQAMLQRGMNQGFSSGEVDVILNLMKQSGKFSKEELNKMQAAFKSNKQKVGQLSSEDISDLVTLKKLMNFLHLPQAEADKFVKDFCQGNPQMQLDLLNNVRRNLGDLMEEKDIKDILELQQNLVNRDIKLPSMDPSTLEKFLFLHDVMEKAGKSGDELTHILLDASNGVSIDCSLSNLLNSVMNDGTLSKKEIEKLAEIQRDLKAGNLKFGGSAEAQILNLIKSENLTKDALRKILLAQKLMANAGISPEDMSKSALIQKSLLESNLSPEDVAKLMQDIVDNTGSDLGEMLKRVAVDAALSGLALTPEDLNNVAKFQKGLGLSNAAKIITNGLTPAQRRLITETVKNSESSVKDLIRVMKSALGDAMDNIMMDALEIASYMERAGASREEIAETMSILMAKEGGGISQDFLDKLRDAVGIEGNSEKVLQLINQAIHEEMSSLATTLRNSFLLRVPTEEEIIELCKILADKLNGSASSRNDVKLALLDILDEALHDVMDYEPDSELVFNYLTVSALAEATDRQEKENINFTGDSLLNMVKERILEMIKRILTEAELSHEIGKIDAFARSIEDVKELLNSLLHDSSLAKKFKRQIAFLFDFNEIEQTTVLGLSLHDIIKEAKHKLKPWDLAKIKKAKGYRTAKMPNLAYSQVFCFYKILPDHIDGPPIGVNYELM